MSKQSDSFDSLSEDLREAYKSGRKDALLQAIQLSIINRKPIPDWAAAEFERAFKFVTMGFAKSWDEVFGQPHPKGMHGHRIRLDSTRFAVYRYVRELHEKGAPIDDTLFERVGRDTGLGGKTIIKELYSRVERVLQRVKADKD